MEADTAEAKQCLGHQKLEEAKKDSSERVQPCQYLDFRPPASRL